MKRLFFVFLLLLAVTEVVRSEPQLDLTIRALNQERRLAAEVGANVAFAVLEEMNGAFDDLDLTFYGDITVAGDLGNGVLGRGHPSGFVYGEYFGAPDSLEDVSFPLFLAELLAREDLVDYGQQNYGVTIATNQIPWNYDPEGRGREGQFCCVSTAAHEASHGQGFGMDDARVDEEGNGFVRANNGRFTIWTYFLEDEDGTPLYEYEEGSRELGRALTNEAVFWGGRHGTRANGGERIHIYAPRQFNASSISHLSQEYEEEETMVPLSRQGEDFQRLSLGPRETAMFRDMLGIPFENNSPVMADIEDQAVSEDDTLLVALDISDEDGDAVTLTVSSEREEVTVLMTEEGVLSCIPDPNWHGETLVTLIASDIFEGADTLSFTLTVEPVNDAPESFTLLSPQDGFEENDTSAVITFRWRASRDADGDDVSYGLVIRNANFEETYETENLSHEVSANALPSNEEIRWHVWATDGTDTVETNERTLTILVNRAPMFVQEIGDTSISEDHILSILLYASDPDRDEMSYTASSSAEAVRLTIQTNRLTLTPNPNWFGEARISVTVSDGTLSDTFMFRVTVTPINDPPEMFSLLTPDDGYRTSDTLSSIQFSWEESEDIDGDSVLYTVIFRSREREWQEETSTLTLLRSSSDFPREEQISWHVSATDGGDTVTTETWEFKIENPNGVPDFKRIPTDFSLQNYPNPFNAVTTIQYSVPAPGSVHMTMYDLAGRTVRKLTDKFHETGIYTFPLDASALDAGVYILTLEQNGRTVSVRKMTLLR